MLPVRLVQSGLAELIFKPTTYQRVCLSRSQWCLLAFDDHDDTNSTNHPTVSLAASMAAHPILLASTSPRRRMLLDQAGVRFCVLGIDIDETYQAGECAEDYLIRMVTTKMQAAQTQLARDQNTTPSEHSSLPTLIITADTIGVTRLGEILTKPVDLADAKRMWRQLSGTWHTIATAVCVGAYGSMVGQLVAQVQTIVRTAVRFVPLDEAMMEAYWATGEPCDKAGGYAIQGRGRAWVDSIDGSYDNVVGLPVQETLTLLHQVASAATSQH